MAEHGTDVRPPVRGARVHVRQGAGIFIGLDKRRQYRRGVPVWEYWAVVKLDDGRTVRVPWVQVHEQVGKP
jgi:hypothetical protein